MPKKKKVAVKPEAIAPEERGHHARSPSSLQYREACPAFENNESSNTEASEAGTRQHRSFEKRDLSICENEIEEWAVQRCLDYTDGVKAEKYPDGCATIQEEYLTVDEQETTAGYPDLVYISKDGEHADVIDLKFGQWAVEPAENNLQGIAYGLGVRYRHLGLKSFTVHFIMPYLDYVDVHKFEQNTFQHNYARIKTVVARSYEKDPEENPNFGTCLFCAKLGSCKSAAAFFTKVGHKFAPLEIPESVDTTRLMDDPAQAGLAMKIASLASAWSSAFKSRMAIRALEDETFMPDDYNLISYPERDLKDEELMVKLARNMGVTKKDIDAVRKLNLGDVEKLVSACFPKGHKKENLELFKKALLDSGAVELGRQVTYLGMKKQKAD